MQVCWELQMLPTLCCVRVFWSIKYMLSYTFQNAWVPWNTGVFPLEVTTFTSIELFKLVWHDLEVA